ncbi:hypothetical protein SERLA73DRAFT_107415 [Serpula lacrymans var. lacrymans S7.3]|uniref:DUF6699 domain-containing protein n=1 Tax=Serpula lacrymans var. lacrymans (strain S7.3) TaxID=936435 RepID=F8PWM3_SERL3|nr:hypothetical protein SERLA73DRAFT_107415 [Serpula lacrymans var. lacrymans S7.3]
MDSDVGRSSTSSPRSCLALSNAQKASTSRRSPKTVQFQDTPRPTLQPSGNKENITTCNRSTYSELSSLVHPFLALSAAPIVYDIREPPSTLRFPPLSAHQRHSYRHLAVPLTSSSPRHVRIISKEFPWSFELDYTRRVDHNCVTCLDVLSALYSALQAPLADHEWGVADESRRKSMQRARARRIEAGGSALLQRVDWLGSRAFFGGLRRDDKFAKQRLCPGTVQVTETWLVKFRI